MCRLDGKDRHPGAEAPRGAGELARVAERLDVQDRELGGAVLLHHVSRSLLETSYLLPTEANEEIPSPSRDRRSTSAKPRPPDCDHEADPARRRVTRSEGRVQADAGHGDTEAVWTDEPHAVPAAGCQQVGALGGVKARRDHHHGLDTASAALVGHGRTAGGTATTARSAGSGSAVTDGRQGTPSMCRACGLTA